MKMIFEWNLCYSMEFFDKYLEVDKKEIEF